MRPVTTKKKRSDEICKAFYDNVQVPMLLGIIYIVWVEIKRTNINFYNVLFQMQSQRLVQDITKCIKSAH